MLLYHDVGGTTLAAKAAEGAGLIASCLPLESAIAKRDVFPNRMGAAD